MSWRTHTDRLKKSKALLHVAAQLGQGKGRFRWLDRFSKPPPAPLKPNLSNWNEQALAAAWIGHATVLLRMAGMNILTDPVFSARVGLGFGLFTVGPMRKFAPALSIDELPKLDLILISHAHFDHLDRPSLYRMPKDAAVVTSSQTRDLIRDLGFADITELHWGEQKRFGKLTIRAHEARHWGARTFLDTYRGYNSYFLEGPAHRVLYAADTAYGKHFAGCGKVDLGIFNIGAYDPYIQAHANPEQVWQMAMNLPAEHILPAHHSTFQLSHEAMNEPLERLLVAAGKEQSRIVARRIGETWWS